MIVKSVPSPSIFSPSLPKVKPISVPMFISPPAPTVIDRSVPSDSSFSVPASKSPVFAASATSVVAVKLIVFPVIVKSVPSPSIFSPSSPKVKPMLADRLTSAPETICKSVPSP